MMTFPGLVQFQLSSYRDSKSGSSVYCPDTDFCFAAMAPSLHSIFITLRGVGCTNVYFQVL